MSAYPRITVVTPSFNQAPYIEQTLCSVLDQGYPNLEYIVIDGGSTDGSADIIRRYADRLTYWVSEPDQGQTHAINKGMARATGELRAYLNSDDLYVPGALELVAEAYSKHPGADLFYGDCRVIDEEGQNIGGRRASISRFEEILDLWGVWWQTRNFVQPEVFWTRRIAEKIGPLRDELHFVMDYDYWTRMLRVGAKAYGIESELACFRMTSTQKSNLKDRSASEILAVVKEYLWDPTAPLSPSVRWKLQGEWLYTMRFLPAVEQSVTTGESRRRRYARLLTVIAQHPSILMSHGLVDRSRGVFGGSRPRTELSQ